MIPLLSLLASHADLIGLVIEAIERGVSKQRLIDAVKLLMTAASDEMMRMELK